MFLLNLNRKKTGQSLRREAIVRKTSKSWQNRADGVKISEMFVCFDRALKTRRSV